MNTDKLRPCIVTIPAIKETTRNYNGEKKTRMLKPEETHTALFHRWIYESMVVGDSLLIGGAPGGQISHAYGLVEYEDGEVQRVDPGYIRFTDRKTAKESGEPKYSTITDIVEQLEFCGYTCEAGPLEKNIAFMRLKEISEMEKKCAHVMIKLNYE